MTGDPGLHHAGTPDNVDMASKLSQLVEWLGSIDFAKDALL